MAEDVMNAYVEFDALLSGIGRFPNGYFRVFYDDVVRYLEAAEDHKMIHRSAASDVSSLSEIVAM